MFLKEFVKTVEFEELLQKHIYDNGGEIGVYKDSPFIIVSSTEDVDALENEVILMVEELEIYIDRIFEAYLEVDYLSFCWGFSDEYSFTSCCGAIVETSPSYHTPEYVVDYERGGTICKKCLLENPDWYVDSLTNNYKRANSLIPESEFEERGFEKSNVIYQTGLHSGMNDAPKEVLAELQKQGYDVIFNITTTSQFYMEWQAWVKLVEYECYKCGAECDIHGIDLKTGICFGCIELEEEEDEEE